MADLNKSFVFYKSFFDAMQLLQNDDKIDFITLICNLAFNETEPELEGSAYSDIVKALYTVSAAQIKASIKHRADGLKGGTQKGVNIKNSRVNSPLFSPLNTNVNDNVNVNANVKVNDNVNDNVLINDKSFFITKDLLIKCCDVYGLKLDEKAINHICSVPINDEPEKAINARLAYVFTKYENKNDDEKKALFIRSFTWDNIPATDAKKEKPKAKKTNLDFYKTAPKTCSRCGSKVVRWPGVPKTVICENCKTYWEYKEGAANEWKCSRDAEQ